MGDSVISSPLVVAGEIEANREHGWGFRNSRVKGIFAKGYIG
jgi:hypothetical protein